MPKIRTIIVDDNHNFRTMAKKILTSRPEIEIVGEATDGIEALRKAQILTPDLVLMDISMPRMNGIESTRLLKQKQPSLKVIILTAHFFPEYREAAAVAGSDGYIEKKSINKNLLPTIETVMSARKRETLHPAELDGKS